METGRLANRMRASFSAVPQWVNYSKFHENILSQSFYDVEGTLVGMVIDCSQDSSKSHDIFN